MINRRPSKQQVLELIRDRGIEFSTILDVGVLTGTPELIKAFPDRHHCLFEPVIEFKRSVEEAYSQLSHEFICCAISNSDGEVTIETTSIISGTEISHSAMIDSPAALPYHRTVPMFKLDSFLSLYPRKGPYLLKIDIDGHELRVLEGAHLTLQESSVVIIEASYSTLSARLMALEHHGFEIFDIAEPVYYDDAFWQCDLVMIKPEMRRRNFKNIHVDFNPDLYIPYR